MFSVRWVAFRGRSEVLNASLFILKINVAMSSAVLVLKKKSSLYKGFSACETILLRSLVAYAQRLLRPGNDDF